MKIVLANAKWWRFKKIVVLLGCMGIGIFAIALIKNDRLNTGFLFVGLVLYAIIIESPWIERFSYEIYVEDRGTEIYIKKKKKEYSIKKSEIKDVLWKEIRYGGRWLETVGYRLTVVADKKYIFDSVLTDGDTRLENHDLEELLKIFQKSI